MRAFAAEQLVVKDPAFCFTLPVWIAAGASLDHVVATVRPAADSARSRLAAGLAGYANEDVMRSAIALELGVLWDTLLQGDVPFSVLPFPAWTRDGGDLVKALPFPNRVAPDTLKETLNRLSDTRLVHHGGGG